VPTAAQLDLAGALALAVGLGGGLLAVSRVRVAGWGSPVVVAGLAAAVAFATAWVRIERRAPHPTMDPGLFRNAPFAVANALNLGANASMFVIWLLAPYYLVEVRGLSTIAGGLVLGAQPAAAALVSPLAGRLDGRIPTGRLCTLGLVAEAAGLGLVALLADGAPVAAVALAFALVGGGLGLFSVPNLSYVMGSIERDRQGVAGGLTQMTRTVGVVSGVAFASLVFDARRLGHARRLGVEPADPAPFVAAFRDVFLLAAVTCTVAAAASLVRAPRTADVMPAGAPR
jgi:MFS family permease